ncbi:hypothetical protein BDK51DRAFT_38262 [Blyttiomyces helicus]|uniref:Uncharacterized protein n=1 Tax=Blyttiomyces helicus TaxID=388810 RepID=A0A4P9W4P4_9FUNG|nr:hypothetical protein BDK51DRAFT_38262 [Blyttiomyces helicus]|eukprot:RKO86882.1 hypothetical protein BDK51DRAFT_38262 [Blyttiomyces helicus]
MPLVPGLKREEVSAGQFGANVDTRRSQTSACTNAYAHPHSPFPPLRSFPHPFSLSVGASLQANESLSSIDRLAMPAPQSTSGGGGAMSGDYAGEVHLLNSENAQLRARIVQLEAERTQNRIIVSRLQAENERLGKDLATTSAELATCTAERDMIHSTMALMTNRLVELGGGMKIRLFEVEQFFCRPRLTHISFIEAQGFRKSRECKNWASTSRFRPCVLEEGEKMGVRSTPGPTRCLFPRYPTDVAHIPHLPPRFPRMQAFGQLVDQAITPWKMKLRLTDERVAKLQRENDMLRAKKIQLLDKALNLKTKLKTQTAEILQETLPFTTIAARGGAGSLSRYKQLPSIG